MLRTLLSLALLLVFLTPSAAAPVVAAARCFPEAGPAIRDCIDGRIAEFWSDQGGLPVFGYPIGPATQAAGSNGSITIQPFERARLEHHPNNAVPYDVLLGRLGADLLAARGEAAAPAEAPQSGCRYFAETGLNLCPPFLAAFERYGLDLGAPGISSAESLALFGLPLTPPRSELLSDGNWYTVQWFERARFEDHGKQGILFGLLGRELATAPVSVPRADHLPPGGFVIVVGDQLQRLDRQVTIKGVNYYPQGRPWKEMWERWDAPQMERELRLARDQLGINTVRMLLPYDLSRRNGQGIVDNRVIDRLRQLTHIAGNLDLRLLVTLFDFEDDFPAAGTKPWQAHETYARTLIGNFAGDDRILGWDIHNEPDNYRLWARDGREDEVLDWMGRMADIVHEAAPNHLVTVGMGHYDNLLKRGPDGRRPIDYSDVVSMHIYNARDAIRQIDTIRAATTKPILIEEFGWPTGPECAVRDYIETEQREVYRLVIEAAQTRTVGVIAWTLRDYDAGPTMRWETREEHYGLVRADHTLKPAAAFLAAYPAEPLPSLTRVPVQLTADVINPPDGSRAPLFIPESSRYIKGEFRRIWEAINGRFSLGPPLSEAFVRADDRRVVQYFSGAVLEYHPEVRDTPEWLLLTPEEQLLQLVRPVNIGVTYTQGRTFPPQQGVNRDSSYYFRETGYMVDRMFQNYYDAVGGRWRLGAPISPQLSESIDGQSWQVQYFEHGRLQRKGVGDPIEIGALGDWAWEIQCTFVR
ncbi:MAG: cellulase family glycosylhydrolase [Oscillochloris sp.]|nr:cellulase family glycosylhydrolase [Oscillochloris sp.]